MQKLMERLRLYPYIQKSLVFFMYEIKLFNMNTFNVNDENNYSYVIMLLIKLFKMVSLSATFHQCSTYSMFCGMIKSVFDLKSVVFDTFMESLASPHTTKICDKTQR